MRVRVEVCVGSIQEALAAVGAGVDGIELCTWLACGGITPGPGLVSLVKERVKDHAVTRRVLVRPAPGGFRYSPDEQQVILRDALLLGVADDEAGVVTGALGEDGLVDVRLMDVVKAALGPRELTFHRAIDHASDPVKAIDQCAQLGIQRVLSSGGSTLASDGAVTLKRMVERAGDKLLVAAAGGIHAGNVVALIERTGVAEIHFAAQKPSDRVMSGAAMSSANVGVNFETEPDVAKIEAVLNALVKAGLR